MHEREKNSRPLGVHSSSRGDCTKGAQLLLYIQWSALLTMVSIVFVLFRAQRRPPRPPVRLPTALNLHPVVHQDRDWS